MAGEPKRRGRPPHQPSDDSRALVREMVAAGRTVDDIALAVGISEPTLRAHYPQELATPRPQITFPFAATPTAPQPARDRAGRPPHVPDADSRRRVEVLVAAGMPQWQIAAAIEVSEPTLREHYAQELETGGARKRAELLVSLFDAGTAGNVSAVRAFLAQPVALNDPPPPPPPKPDPLGKKEAAQLAALSAESGTDWAHLLPN
jgi:DNA-binding CsgD family transcriptional regulator